MPKNETLEIQKILAELGERLGFISKIEERIHSNDTYAPIYDAVWYLDLSKYFKLDELKPLFSYNPILLQRMELLPFAGFEVEGSTTTSKNQIGNFANLHAGHFLFNFEIVNNSAAINENDTYRRGMKIFRHCNQMLSLRNDIFMDKAQLIESINLLPEKTNANLNVTANSDNKRGTCGGEKAESLKMFSEILPMLQKSNLTIVQNKEPVICSMRYYAMKQAFSDNINNYGKHFLSQNYYNDPITYTEKCSSKAKDSLYIPKMDIEAGFDMPEGFFTWIKCLGKALKYDSVCYPVVFGISENIVDSYFISLIGIEIENSVNKHLNGGICNMANYSYAGILSTSQDASGHIKFLSRELGINNVTYYICGGKK